MDNKSVFQNSFNLANLAFRLGSCPTFMTFIETDEGGRNVVDSIMRWAGGARPDSNSPMNGPWKAATLLAKGPVEGISMTPIPGFDKGCHFRGGFRKDDLIVSASGWQNDNLDRMWALFFYYSMHQEVRFHHVGFQHRNEEEFENAVKQAKELYGVAVHSPLEDCDRYYFRIKDASIPNGAYYVEHELYPNNLLPGLHFDFATTHPESAVGFIAEHLDPNSPTELQLFAFDHGRRENEHSVLVSGPEEGKGEVALRLRHVWNQMEDW